MRHAGGLRGVRGALRGTAGRDTWLRIIEQRASARHEPGRVGSGGRTCARSSQLPLGCRRIKASGQHRLGTGKGRQEHGEQSGRVTVAVARRRRTSGWSAFGGWRYGRYGGHGDACRCNQRATSPERGKALITDEDRAGVGWWVGGSFCRLQALAAGPLNAWSGRQPGHGNARSWTGRRDQSSRWFFSRRSWRSWASMLKVAIGLASRRLMPIGSCVSSQKP